MSKNAKRFFIIIIVTIGICIIISAITVGGIGLWIDRNATTDPEKAKQMAHEFINYDLPIGYIERIGTNLFIYKVIGIRDADDDSNKPVILLAYIPGTNGMTQDELKQVTTQMQEMMKQMKPQKGSVNLEVIETRNVIINGIETELTVSEGTSNLLIIGKGIQEGTTIDEDIPYRQWRAAFPAKTGLVMLIIEGEISAWDDDVFEKFLASIRN